MSCTTPQPVFTPEAIEMPAPNRSAYTPGLECTFNAMAIGGSMRPL